MLKKERTVEEVRGVLSKVDLASHKLELIDTVGMMHEMNLATTASISVNGKESTLSALSAGNQVAISYLVELDGSQTAFWIDVTQSEPNPSSQ